MSLKNEMLLFINFWEDIFQQEFLKLESMLLKTVLLKFCWKLQDSQKLLRNQQSFIRI